MLDSLENQLLHVSLLCGMKPKQDPAYRLQLFFIANKDLGSKSHQSDFQRALETGVDSKGLWENYEYKGSGEYLITQLGYRIANELFGKVDPKYRPVRSYQYRTRIAGTVGSIDVEIETVGKKSTVFLNNKECPSAKEACRIIENEVRLYLPTTGESAVRVLYNMAIDQEFKLYWEA